MCFTELTRCGRNALDFHRTRQRHLVLHKLKVEHIIRAGFANSSSAEQVLSTVFLPEKSECFRFCIYCHCLSFITKNVSYSTSRVDECVNFLDEGHVFLTLVDENDHWQTTMGKNDIDATAFCKISQVGLPYEEIVCAEIALLACQRVKDAFQACMVRQFALLYDDIYTLLSMFLQTHF